MGKPKASAPIPEPAAPKPPKKSRAEIMADVLAGRKLFVNDDLHLDRLNRALEYHVMLTDIEALKALKGISDVVTTRVGIYADELSKQLVPDVVPTTTKRGKEVEAIPPSTAEDELRKMYTVEELEKVSLVLKRLNECREKVAVEYRELVPEEKKDNFYTPQSRSYNEWKREFDETIGSSARPAQAPSPANDQKTAEPKQAQVQAAKKRTSSRSSRPV